MDGAVVKPDYFREICGVDISDVREKLLRLHDKVWDLEDARKENRYAVLEDTRHIVARFGTPYDSYSTPFWDVWRKTLEPILTSVAAHYALSNVDYPKVMFARLGAGKKIAPHFDIGRAFVLTHKIHVPIVTNDKVWFRVGKKDFQLEAGKAYEINNVKFHSVRNDGATDRIHLIFEIFDRGAA